MYFRVNGKIPTEALKAHLLAVFKTKVKEVDKEKLSEYSRIQSQSEATQEVYRLCKLDLVQEYNQPPVFHKEVKTLSGKVSHLPQAGTTLPKQLVGDVHIIWIFTILNNKIIH